METSVSQKVIDRIKTERIEPTPSWEFSVWRGFVISLLVLLVLAGALSFGIIFDLIKEYEVARFFSRPQGMKVFFLSLPYLWLIFLTIFLGLAAADFARTRNGYRYRLRDVAIALFLAMLILGGAFHALGFCESIEDRLESSFPAYGKLAPMPENVWSQPEYGLLSGMIIWNDAAAQKMEVEDWAQNVWDIDYTGMPAMPFLAPAEGQVVRIVGNEVKNNKFKAEDIRPWPKGKMKMRKDRF